MNRRNFVRSAVLAFILPRIQGQTEDPWSAGELIQPDGFAKELASQHSARHILYVGFPILYKGAHIKGALFAGPGSKEEGLARLRRVAVNLPRNVETVIYCGCCPFDHCPNIRPAYSAMRMMRFEKLKVLCLPNNLHTDWILKGYPVEKEL